MRAFTQWYDTGHLQGKSVHGQVHPSWTGHSKGLGHQHMHSDSFRHQQGCDRKHRLRIHGNGYQASWVQGGVVGKVQVV